MAPSPAEARPGESGDELSAAFLEALKTEPLRELTVLDAGTGSGRVALALAPLSRAVVGVDRDARAIDEARRKAAAAKLTNVRFVVGDVEVEEYVPFKPDLVVAYLCMSDAIAERAVAGSPAGHQRDPVPGTDRGAVAGRAAAVRAVEDAVQAVRSVAGGRHVGAD
jgi:SAM-dependent methyltransferase